MVLKLIKWIGIGAVVTGVAGYVLFGSNVTSYLGTAASSLRERVHDNIPIEFELRRAENLIKEIEPQLHEARRDLAQAEVDLENLEEEVESLQLRVQTGENKLQHVSAALTGETGGFALAGWDRTKAELDLERTFEQHKSNLAILQAKQVLIERQTRTVAAAKVHVEAVQNEKAKLEDMVTRLKTQKRQLDALAASSRTIQLDDTALGRAREVLDEVKNRLDVAQRMLEDELFFEPEGAGGPRRDIVSEVRRFLSDEGGKAVEATEYVEVR